MGATESDGDCWDRWGFVSERWGAGGWAAVAGTVGVPTSQANHEVKVVTLAAARRMLLTGAPLSARRAFGASLEALEIRVRVGLCVGFCIGSILGCI